MGGAWKHLLGLNYFLAESCIVRFMILHLSCILFQNQAWEEEKLNHQKGLLFNPQEKLSQNGRLRQVGSGAFHYTFEGEVKLTSMEMLKSEGIGGSQQNR